MLLQQIPISTSKHSRLLLPSLYTVDLPSTSTTNKSVSVSTMSAPNEGRQSPEPEQQSNKQTGQTADPNAQGAAPSETHAQEASKEQLKNLPSNPEPPLAKAAEEKTSKTMS
ncbi:hypothetical protein H2203_007368 [Taxawa tesnikishii (nom. ined.)]|nr:hypothetical protein H2203_007368 [Dothideales sp. JES 119]